MSFVQNPYSLLVEAAAGDLSANTEGVITESEIRSRMRNIEEAAEPVNITAEMVPVIAVGKDCLVEMTYLAGFMKSSGVKKVEEALNLIAEANNLNNKEVGLLVESDNYIEAMLEKADKMKNTKSKNKLLDKIKKSTDISEDLQKKGYKVKKKVEECDDPSFKAEGKNCGKCK